MGANTTGLQFASVSERATSSDQHIKDNGTCQDSPIFLKVISRNKYIWAVSLHVSSCSSYFHGCCVLTLVMGDDCTRAAAGSHHHAL